VLSTVNLPQYVATEPLLIDKNGILRFDDPKHWQSPENWVSSLEQVNEPVQAVILPLELPAPGWNLQDLYGVQLLTYLRWSAPDRFRALPVLAMSWQPLMDILRKRFEVMLIRPALEFQSLPVALNRIPHFASAVLDHTIAPTSITKIVETFVSASGLARRVSYHDLANDYYAADRLWKGYKSLLQHTRGLADAREAEIARVTSVRFEWETGLAAKLRSPYIRQFQAARAGVPVPQYPIIDNRKEVLAHHLTSGLPADTRILLLDDEFDKGTAEALLQILFRKERFTRRMEDEWVYSEESVAEPNSRWARFVCVKTVPLALNWLVHWGDVPQTCLASKEHWRGWLERWMRELAGNDASSTAHLDSQDILGENLHFKVDCRRVEPKAPYTVIMLDLRLTPVTETIYSVHDFPSVQFRSTVKSNNAEIPVIMFTASRQIMNSAELLDSTSEIDGWLVKEGPDIPVDSEDTNSASAAAYLLERIHLYSTLASWYRQSFGWDTKRKLACAQFYSSSHVEQLMGEVTRAAQEIFDNIRQGSMQCPPGDTFLTFIQSHVPAHPFPVIQTLVARRVAIGALLLSATIQNGSLEWDADAAEVFDRLLPGRPTKKFVKAVYDKLNFNQVLWMRSANILSQLLREEFDWLERQDWPIERRGLLHNALQRERHLLDF
jgi:hypothetical protein